MNETDITSDLYSNKDALLSVSTFLSLKQLGLLRETSKQFNSWLSDYSSFSWKNRIELSFPTTFQQVLKEDTNTQIDRLQKFDSLVDSGHQVSFYSAQALLKSPSAVEVNAKYQVPWSRGTYVFVYNKNNAVVCDSVVAHVKFFVEIEDMKSIDGVLFDIQNNKLGFVNKVTGAMKLFSLTDNSLKFESDFTCDKLKKDDEDELIPQIYGDNIIVRAGYTRLVWYSLSTGKQVKEVPVPGNDGVFVVPSQVEPVIYTSATFEDVWDIYTVDCTLEKETTIKRFYRGSLDIEWDNCGDGVADIDIIHTEDGSVLNVYLLGTGDRAFRALDLCTGQRVLALHFGEWWGYKSIKCNPGSNFYSIKSGKGLAIMDAKQKYEDDKCYTGQKTMKFNDEDDESEDEDQEDPTEGAYFKFDCKVKWSKWLNKDLFTVKSVINGHSRQLFFSIAKRGTIGYINDDIEEVFIAGNIVTAFTPQGDFYRIKLTSSSETEGQEKNENKDEVRTEQRDQPANRKRKLSERDNDGKDSDVEESPTKKRKTCARRYHNYKCTTQHFELVFECVRDEDCNMNADAFKAGHFYSLLAKKYEKITKNAGDFKQCVVDQPTSVNPL